MNLPVKDYPAVIGMPHFEAPAHLDGRDDDRLRVTGFTGVQIGGPPIEDVGRKLAAQSITLNAKFEPVGAFARMLAKIAYGSSSSSCLSTHARREHDERNGQDGPGGQEGALCYAFAPSPTS